MSLVKVNSIQDASGGSNAILYGAASPVGSMGFRNRLINGGMVFDQRKVGASIAFPAGDGNYCLDRWRLQRQGAATGTIQRVTTAPTGFTHSLKVTVSSGASPSATDFFTVGQIIEGLNCADLAWGTASAVAVTIGFWINSSITGTYAASVYNWGGGSDAYPATFTVNAANTWEFKTVNIPGATAGTWAVNNTGSIYFRIDLGSGSNFNGTANAWNSSGGFRTSSSANLMANTGATLYLTGVQFEAGTFTTAPAFERRDIGRELILCQRYFEKTYSQAFAPGDTSGYAGGAYQGALFTLKGNTAGVNEAGVTWQYKVVKRAVPIITFYAPNNGAAGNFTAGSTANAAGINGPIIGDSNSLAYGTAAAGGNDCYFHMTAESEL
jgi:hypothetical protein